MAVFGFELVMIPDDSMSQNSIEEQPNGRRKARNQSLSESEETPALLLPAKRVLVVGGFSSFVANEASRFICFLFCFG